MSSSPSKTSGQWHSTMGNAKEGLGKVIGSTNLKQQGRQEHIRGEAEYNAARAQGYVQGTQDRTGGKKDSIVGSITGDRSKQTTGNLRQNKGSAQQNFNRTF